MSTTERDSPAKLREPLEPAEQAVLARLVREHREPLYAFALKLCGQREDAHDLVQDTFERAARSGSTELTRSWLFTVLHHLFVDQYRRKLRGPLLSSVDQVDVAAREPEPTPRWATLSAADVHRAMEQLPADMREAYALHSHEGLGYAEIAARLGVATSTIGARIMRARRKLRDILQTMASPNEGQ